MKFETKHEINDLVMLKDDDRYHRIIGIIAGVDQSKIPSILYRSKALRRDYKGVVTTLAICTFDEYDVEKKVDEIPPYKLGKNS